MTTRYDTLLEHYQIRANAYMRERVELIAAITRYVEYGLEPGSFLTSVLRNDLRESCMHADEMNKANLFSVVEFCYNNLPRTCWGSPEKVDAWIADKNDAR